MYNEVFGVPGVGKTTFCNKSNNVVIKKINNIMNLKIKYCFKPLYKTKKLYSFISDYIPITKKERIRFKRGMFVCLYHYYITIDNNKQYISDHGMIQTLSQIKGLHNINDNDFWIKVFNILPPINGTYINKNINDIMKQGKQRSTFDRTTNELRSFQKFFNMMVLYLSTK